MFVLICALILAFHAIFCQSESESQLATIKLDKIKNLIGVKATNNSDVEKYKGIFIVRENNEIEFFVENLNFTENVTHNGQLRFLTKIKDRLEFRVRKNKSLSDNDNANRCRLQFLSKHCNVTNNTISEYYVECRQKFNNPETYLWSTAWQIRHDEKDRYQIDGWETEEYPIYAILHMKHEYGRSLWATKCSYSIVFNSQRGESRKGNRDYVLLIEREEIPWKNREEWFTRDKPQPSNRKPFPPGLRLPKKRWEIPKGPLVEFMADKEE